MKRASTSFARDLEREEIGGEDQVLLWNEKLLTGYDSHSIGSTTDEEQQLSLETPEIRLSPLAGQPPPNSPTLPAALSDPLGVDPEELITKLEHLYRKHPSTHREDWVDLTEEQILEAVLPAAKHDWEKPEATVCISDISDLMDFGRLSGCTTQKHWPDIFPPILTRTMYTVLNGCGPTRSTFSRARPLDDPLGASLVLDTPASPHFSFCMGKSPLKATPFESWFPHTNQLGCGLDIGQVRDWFANSGITIGAKAHTQSQIDLAQTLCFIWRDRFITSLKQLEVCPIVTHRIEVIPGARPKKVGQTRYNRKHISFSQKVFWELQEAGIVRRESLPWAARTLYVPKKPSVPGIF